MKLKKTLSSLDMPEWQFWDLPSPLVWDMSAIELSSAPGVYTFLDDTNTILYVGKAKRLKDRLASYRRTAQMLPRTLDMISKVVRTRYYEVETELDALLMEAELIRLYQPRYNVLLKDDKSPLYITISKELYPKVLAMRKEKVLASSVPLTLFGPYPSGKKVRQILKIARRSFPYCSKRQHTGKPCFYYQLGWCQGACIEAITPAHYQETIKSLTLFLRGKKHRLRRRLKRSIELKAGAEDYEGAELLKNQLETFEYITRHYKGTSTDAPLPNLTDDVSEFQLIHLRKLLTSTLSLPNNYSLERIEAYDISNTQGTHATGSMVVMEQGKPAFHAYRRFKIRRSQTPNDVAMMREMLSRRVAHNEWPIPQLIIIDGGRGQLNGALKEIPWSIPIISLVKRPERLLIPSWLDGKRTYHSETITTGTPIANLVQQLRDESHRFAKTYHGLLAKKGLLSS